MNNSIGSHTIQDDLCIGCGFCEVVCPTNAITMLKCEENYLKPKVDGLKCINCGLCYRYCPNSFESLKEEAKKVAQHADYVSFGVDNGMAWYTGCIKDSKKRKMSASGGIVTYLAEKLLKDKKIDSVIHASMLYAKTGDLHYAGKRSTTVEELDTNRSSFYGAISFNKVLRESLVCGDKSILFIGTPCVIRGAVKLFKEHPQYKKIRLYTIALSCSHNVNGLFIDYLADSMGVSREEKYKVNLRYKNDGIDANHYYNRYYNNDFSIELDRFESQFTKQWRNYSFSMNVCNACSDFWGYCADVSIKDAWGKWSDDPLGKSMMIVRNLEIDEMITSAAECMIDNEEYEEVRDAQLGTVLFKQGNCEKKARCKKASDLNDISFAHKVNCYMRKKSIHGFLKRERTDFLFTANAGNAIRKIYDKVIKIVSKDNKKI